MKYDDSQKLSKTNYPQEMMFVCNTEDESVRVLEFVKSIGWDTDAALNVPICEWSEWQTNLHCYDDKTCGFFRDVEDDLYMEGVPKFTADSIFIKESEMYINKRTHEVVKDCDLTLEHAYDENYICVPEGVTFATGNSFDDDFVWRKDREYFNVNYWQSTDVTLETQRDFYKLNMLWIHPDIKQKMLEGEIPNQITEKEWMKFDYSKLIGCVVSYGGEDIVVVELDQRYPVGCFVTVNDSGGGGFISIEEILNKAYFYLEDGTMVGFDEYKGVYYNE